MSPLLRLFFGPTLILALATSPLSAVAEEPLQAPELDQAKALSILTEASGHFDELAQLPESRWIRRDQSSANRDINKLIEEAISVLDIPELVTLRTQYAAVEERVRAEQLALAELREKRIMAPDQDARTLTRWTPTETLRNFTASTRGDYELLIEARKGNIQGYLAELAELRTTMAEKLRLIDVDMPADQIELWLSSAIGSDVISMGVVFNSIRTITERLEILTQESGENLTFAKRYYGMVVILHKLVVHVQEGFVARVDNDVLPRLAGFRDEADDIIAESRRLLREGGNQASLNHNIRANELTKRAIALYEEVVRGQRDKVADALRISRREEAVAINTYRTVSLSANVASLIQEGLSTFETLYNLQVPDSASFENAEIREEFRKLTERIGATQ